MEYDHNGASDQELQSEIKKSAVSGNEQADAKEMQQEKLEVNWEQQEEKLKGSSFRLEDQGALKSIKNRKVSQLLVGNHDVRKDSPEMVEVKTNLKMVDQFITKKFDALMTPDVIDEMKSLYQLAISSCAYYCARKKPFFESGKIRLELVKETMASLREEMDRLSIIGDRVGEKTVSEFLFANFVSKIQIERREVQETEEDRQLNEGKEQENLKQKKTVDDLLNMKIDSSSVLEEKEDANGNKVIDSPYLRLCESVRKFPKSKVYVEDLAINGTRIQLLQKSDGSLHYALNGTLYPLQMSADTMADRLESNIMKQPEQYGKDNIVKLLRRMEPTGDAEDNPETLRVRNVCMHFLQERSGVPVADYNMIPTECKGGFLPGTSEAAVEYAQGRVFLW